MPYFPRRAARALTFFFVVPITSVLLGAAQNAHAAEGDVFAKGATYCASTYAGHGTIPGFGAPLDLNAAWGSDYRWPLYAPADGSVSVYALPGWGNSIIWTSTDGNERIHMAHLDVFGKLGEVNGGDFIGRVGHTGHSDGDHLHMDAQRNGGPAQIVLSGHALRAGHCYVSLGPVVATCLGQSATMVGTDAKDKLRGTSGDDVICGGAGDDVLVGVRGSDRLSGAAGDDILSGGRGADELLGNGASDILVGGIGDDRLSGGSGADTATYSGAPQTVRVDLERGVASGEGTDSLASVEDVFGSQYRDWLTGGGRNNDLFGLHGNDTLIGGPGRDRATGGPGIDTCDAETMADCEPPAPAPTPAPSPTLTPSPSPTLTPSPSPSESVTPSPSPPSVLSLGAVTESTFRRPF